MKKIILLLSPILLLLTACETDFDVTGDWKEITVVYGLLDKNQTTQYIRINKGFLGDKDAYLMAEENDSINFSNLTVKLIEFTESGTAVDSFELDTTYVTLENGIFGNPGNPIQKLWKTNEVIDPAKIYKLKVVNNYTGKVVTAETPIVKTFNIAQPSAAPVSKISFFGNNATYAAYSIKFGKSPTDNIKVYEVTIVFYYRDVDMAPGGDTTLHSVSWKQSAYVSDGTENLIQIPIEGESFYSYLGSVIPNPEANHKRLIGKGLYDPENDGNADDHIDVVINVGGEELYNYIEINKPAASGVLLDKPVYTNVENGLGIFSSRSVNTVSNKALSPNSIDELKNGQYTADLLFFQEN